MPNSFHLLRNERINDVENLLKLSLISFLVLHFHLCPAGRYFNLPDVETFLFEPPVASSKLIPMAVFLPENKSEQ